MTKSIFAKKKTRQDSAILPIFRRREETAVEILMKSTFITIDHFDRGYEVWDPEGLNERTGKPSGCWVWKEDKRLECVVEFTCTSQQGAGRQIIPANEFPEYVQVLAQIHESGYKEPDPPNRERYVPTHVIARESFKMVYPRVKVNEKYVEDTSAGKCMVSIRAAAGRGQKPILVHRDEFEDVLNALKIVRDKLPEYEEQQWNIYKQRTGEDAAEVESDD